MPDPSENVFVGTLITPNNNNPQQIKEDFSVYEDYERTQLKLNKGWYMILSHQEPSELSNRLTARNPYEIISLGRRRSKNFAKNWTDNIKRIVGS